MLAYLAGVDFFIPRYVFNQAVTAHLYLLDIDRTLYECEECNKFLQMGHPLCWSMDGKIILNTIYSYYS